MFESPNQYSTITGIKFILNSKPKLIHDIKKSKRIIIVTKLCCPRTIFKLTLIRSDSTLPKKDVIFGCPKTEELWDNPGLYLVR